MNRFTVYSLLLTAFLLSGCVSRVVPHDVDRVDQELTGNRGIIMGHASSESAVERKKTRRIIAPASEATIISTTVRNVPFFFCVSLFFSRFSSFCTESVLNIEKSSV